MMNLPLSLNHLLERCGKIFGGNQIVSRLPDKSLRTHSYAQYYRRTRALASALSKLGLRKGERVATLCWNHHAHLEAYFGIPAAGGVMHTLNLRLSPDELGWIAVDAQDRYLIVDDILLPLYRQFAPLHNFDKVIVFPFSGAPVPDGFLDYEALLADADPDGFEYALHEETDPTSMCYTSRHHRPPQGRGLFAPLDDPAHAGRLPGRHLGPEGQRRAAAGDADVPRQLLGHALWRGDDGREDGLPRPAPAPRRSARPDAARAADDVAGRADHLDEPDPDLRGRAGGTAGALEDARRACDRWSAARPCPKR